MPDQTDNVMQVFLLGHQPGLCGFWVECKECPAFDISKPFPEETPEWHKESFECSVCKVELNFHHARSVNTEYEVALPCIAQTQGTFRIPSTETAMSSIDDNSKTPYIDHVTKTRSRNKNA